MSPNFLLFFILGIDSLVLLLQTTTLSISADEASLIYGDFSFFNLLISSSLSVFGHNDIGLRIWMIIFHFMSAILMYLISKKYIKQDRNRIWLVLIFLLLPGVVSSAIVVNSAGMIIFGLLLYVYLHEKASLLLLNTLLLFYSLIDIGFSYLFLGLAVYYILNKKNKLFIYMMSLYFLNSFLYGFEVSGIPSGHFLDTIGLYSAIFSPIIFIHIFYILYRRYLTTNVDVIWYISTTVLILSLALSFRQRVAVEHFAPYLIIALPLAAQSFISSYRVRLKIYRTKYKMIFIISFIFLLMNTLAVFFNKELYTFIDSPKHHFIYDMDVAKELANSLKEKGISCIKSDKNMQKRLYFYGVGYCDDFLLKELPLDGKFQSNVTIRYRDTILYRGYVTKINTK